MIVEGWNVTDPEPNYFGLSLIHLLAVHCSPLASYPSNYGLNLRGCVNRLLASTNPKGKHDLGQHLKPRTESCLFS